MKYLLILLLMPITLLANDDLGVVEILFDNQPDVSEDCYLIAVRSSDDRTGQFYSVRCDDYYDDMGDLDSGAGSNIIVNKGWNNERNLRCSVDFTFELNHQFQPTFEMFIDCRVQPMIFKDSFGK